MELNNQEFDEVLYDYRHIAIFPVDYWLKENIPILQTSYADADKSEWRRGLKIWRELGYFPKSSPITDLDILPHAFLNDKYLQMRL